MSVWAASPVRSAEGSLPGRPAVDEDKWARGLCASATPLWSDHGHLSAQALRLIQSIGTSGSLGLEPQDYAAAELAELSERLAARAATDGELRDFDCLLTHAAVRLLSHLHYGRVAPAAAGFELPARSPDLDVGAAVIALAHASDVGVALAAAEPGFFHYALLKAALQRYQALAAQPQWIHLPQPTGKAPHPGSAYVGAPQLRSLLLALGDLPGTQMPLGAEAARDELTPELVEALKRFQRRHGLNPDGALGTATYAALSVPMAQRVRQIELTMERWRWLPRLQAPPIIVNIPQFNLFAFRTTSDRVADIEQMPVIVGRTFPRTQTPVFVGSLRYVIFHPYWDIPNQIAVHEILPQWRAHADYLERNHLEMVRGEEVLADQSRSAAAIAALTSGALRLRQRPGDDNALGPIKFVFPNVHDVYLHGTPAHQLFAQSRRAFSHGCIRVADPVALATYVLRDTPGNWDAQKIAATLQQPASVRVNLAHPIPVMILYGTALATEAGPVDFFDDVYGNDRRLAQLLWPATRT